MKKIILTFRPRDPRKLKKKCFVCVEIFFSKAKRELFLDKLFLARDNLGQTKKINVLGSRRKRRNRLFFPQKIKPPPRSATFRPRPDPTRRKAESPSLTPQGIRFLGRLRPDLTPRDRRSERLYVNTARFRSPGQLNTRKKKNALRNEPSPARKSRGGKK